MISQEKIKKNKNNLPYRFCCPSEPQNENDRKRKETTT